MEGLVISYIQIFASLKNYVIGLIQDLSQITEKLFQMKNDIEGLINTSCYNLPWKIPNSKITSKNSDGE